MHAVPVCVVVALVVVVVWRMVPAPLLMVRSVSARVRRACACAGGRKSDGVPVEEGGECGCGWPRSDTGSTEMHKFLSNGPVPCTERFPIELRAGESIRLGAGAAPERCCCVL